MNVGEAVIGDFRDIQHGVNDPVDGVDVKRRFNDNQTAHERAQFAADVRSSAIPAADEEFLPEALRRRPTGPLNPRTGRHPLRKQNRLHAQFASSIDYRRASAGD
jgi:hypothetical protein